MEMFPLVPLPAFLNQWDWLVNAQSESTIMWFLVIISAFFGTFLILLWAPMYKGDGSSTDDLARNRIRGGFAFYAFGLASLIFGVIPYLIASIVLVIVVTTSIVRGIGIAFGKR